MADYATSARLQGRDRAFASELCHGVIRRRRALDVILSQGVSRPLEKADPKIRNILRMGLYQAIAMDPAPFAAVNEAVNLAKADKSTRHATGFINAALRQTLRNIAKAGLDGAPITDMARAFLPAGLTPEATLAQVYSFPDWWAKRWVAQFGEAAAEEVFDRCQSKSPIFIRPNINAYTIDEVTAKLVNHGLMVEPFPFNPGLLRISEGSLPPDSPLVAEGYIQPQDGASFLAASLLDAGGQDHALDICCGKGIKSGLFAQTAQRVTGFDLDHNALLLHHINMARQKINHVDAIQANMAQPWPVRGSFSKIFIDAPCSGSGLAKRHPEGKWRKGEELITRMSHIQGSILREGARRLAAGGRLVYAICSVEKEEGEANVNSLLVTDGGLSRIPIAHIRPNLIEFQTDKGDMMILPGQYGMDGFYAAVLERR